MIKNSPLTEEEQELMETVIGENISRYIDKDGSVDLDGLSGVIEESLPLHCRLVGLRVTEDGKLESTICLFTG